jgi:hypothetical protein
VTTFENESYDDEDDKSEGISLSHLQGKVLQEIGND